MINMTHFIVNLQKDYAFGYDVNELDEYGNPNVHSRTEVREGPHVKGNNFYLNDHNGFLHETVSGLFLISSLQHSSNTVGGKLN